MQHTGCWRAVHAFVRAPHYRSIPNSGTNGIIVNRDALNHQFRDFYRVLQQSSLVDKIHLMAERPGVDSMRVADQLACVGPTFLGMPLSGLEARASEFMETMRYVRGAGGPSTVAAYLQDNEQCRCSSGDIVCLPTGIAVGHGSRTNTVAHGILKELFEVPEGPMQFHIAALEQEADAPPLGDYFGFAGNNILLAVKDEHGLLAVDQLQQHQQRLGLAIDDTTIVYLEPGCNFFSFYGVDHTTDVLVQKGFERSMDSLAAAGLNPIPVQWSEMDKLGISMRAAVLPLKFLQSGVGGLLHKSKGRGERWKAHQLPK